MEKPHIATFLLSRILKCDVTLENFTTTENLIQYKQQEKVISSITHLDFSAIITDDSGREKKVLIEMQKSGDQREVFRFRHYLACQMIRDDGNQNMIIDPENPQKSFKEMDKTIDLSKNLNFKEIISIYLVNYSIDVTDPIVCTTPILYNPATNQVSKETVGDSLFLRTLYNQIYVVQIPKLGKIYEGIKYEELDERSKMLCDFLDFYHEFGKFSTSNLIEFNDEHYAKYSETFQPLIHELELLAQDEEVQRIMRDQDIYDRINAEREKEKMRLGYMKGLEESREKIEEEQQKRIEAEQEAKLKSIKLAKMMIEISKSIDEIMSDTGLSESEILDLQTKK